ncbi:MAG: AccI family restriction endonuclease [Sulfolobales archaeon]
MKVGEFMAKKPMKAPPPRGLDFLMRNEQGRWAEDLVIDTINDTEKFSAVRYGLSRVVLVKGGREWSEYWEKYQKVEKYGKRPNVLIFKKDVYRSFESELNQLASEYGDPSLIPEDEWEKYVKRAVCALEVEMSLWKASKMPDKDMKLPLKKKDVVAPMIWVKEDDALRLKEWYNKYGKSIYIVQVFYDLAFIAPFLEIIKKAERILSEPNEKKKIELMKREGLIVSKQKFVDERTSTAVSKVVYRLHPSAAKVFGILEEPPTIKVDVLEDERGKILPFLKFSGGILRINQEILNEWEKLQQS